MKNLKYYKLRYKFFFPLLVFIGILGLKFPVLKLPYHWDEILYAKWAHTIIEHNFIPLIPAVHLSPLFSEIIAFCMFISKNSIIGPRIFILLSSTLLVYMTFKVGSEFYNKKVGFLSGLVLFFSPIFFAQTVFVNPEILLGCFLLLVFYSRKNLKRLIFFSVILVLIKPSGFVIFVFLVICFYFNYFKNLKIKKVALFLPFGAGVIYLLYPNGLIYNMLGIPTLYPSFHIEHIKELGTFLFLSDYRILSTLFIPFALFGKKYRKEGLLIVGMLFFYIFIHSFIKQICPRYIIPIMPFYYILAICGVFSIMRKHKIYFILLFLFLPFLNYDLHRRIESPRGSGAVLETNMEYIDVVKTHKEAAEYIEENFKGRKIFTNWPILWELKFPYLGYVNAPLKCTYSYRLADIHPSDIIVYSPQSHKNFVLKQIINKLPTLTIKKFEQNGKYVEILKVIALSNTPDVRGK